MYRVRSFIERNIAKIRTVVYRLSTILAGTMTCRTGGFGVLRFSTRSKASGLRSQMASAVKDVANNPGRSMGMYAPSPAIPSGKVRSQFKVPSSSTSTHTRLPTSCPCAAFVVKPKTARDRPTYAMSTGVWSTQSNHSQGNVMAAAVAVKTGIIRCRASSPTVFIWVGVVCLIVSLVPIHFDHLYLSLYSCRCSTIQQLTSMNQLAIQSHIRRVCTPLDRKRTGPWMCTRTGSCAWGEGASPANSTFHTYDTSSMSYNTCTRCFDIVGLIEW